MLRQVALIFTVLCTLCMELGLAARHLGDISLHGEIPAEAEAMAECKKIKKNDCKNGKKKAPKGFKCEWKYDCYKANKKEAGPVDHPSECGAMKLQGIGVCSAVSLLIPPPIDRDAKETELTSDEDKETELPSDEDEETELPSDEDVLEDSEEPSEEDLVEDVDKAEPTETETMEELVPQEPSAVAAKLEEDDEDEKEEDTTAEFDPDEEKPTDECGGASVHWKTCGTKSDCQYVKKADVESCGVSAWGCYLASDLTC